MADKTPIRDFAKKHKTALITGAIALPILTIVGYEVYRKQSLISNYVEFVTEKALMHEFATKYYPEEAFLFAP